MIFPDFGLSMPTIEINITVTDNDKVKITSEGARFFLEKSKTL